MSIAHLVLPLRGLAGTGAQAAVDAALADVEGVQLARADVAALRLQIEYDDARVSPRTIHDALARAGIGHAPHGDAGHEAGPDRPG